MERFTYHVSVKNPKYKWWNREPEYIEEVYYLKVNEDGYVCAVKE